MKTGAIHMKTGADHIKKAAAFVSLTPGFRSMILFVSISILTPLAVWSQSQCSCNQGNGGCSASQTCPSGYEAVCTCSATGCSSSCNRVNLDGEFTSTGLETVLAEGSSDAISSYFRRTTGRLVTFAPSTKGSRLVLPKTEGGTLSQWEIFEYLAKNGQIKIQGHDLAYWNNMRSSLLKGDEFTICAGRADAALDQISFLSGKKFSILSGNAQAKLDAPIKGNGVVGLIESLRKATGLEISEN